ncbi:MAG: hypothetical protein A3K19_01970 [Lentisphaerae bacterium RIFOXYB12_FULL_65_16]|nr:MAG: hypothetical protein A3K18_29425 [Lentisphaerae bacterium RIFOXYA12_64_32]OGV92645.1 MAG: hypothetical protein A3K19_01970 [Lentisphaerae bacterium RIFOXYB12_FULL_65_16]
MRNIEEKGLKLLHVGHTHPTGEWLMDWHGHTYHELIVFYQGMSHVDLGPDHYDTAPGDVLFYPAGIPHREHRDPELGVEHYFIGFEWPDVPGDVPHRSFDSQGRIRQLTLWLYEEQVNRGFHVTPLKNALFEALMLEWQQLGTTAQHPLVTVVRTFMRRHLADDLRLDDLARHASMSKYHFVRSYARLTGRTPMEDLRHLRLNHAHNLIVSTREPLKAIAAQCGFADGRQMARLFRKQIGYPPKALRAAP